MSKVKDVERAKLTLKVVELLELNPKAKGKELFEKMKMEGFTFKDTKFVSNIRTRYNNDTLNIERLKEIAAEKEEVNEVRLPIKDDYSDGVPITVSLKATDVPFVKRLLNSAFMDDTSKIIALKEYFEVPLEEVEEEE